MNRTIQNYQHKNLFFFTHRIIISINNNFRSWDSQVKLFQNIKTYQNIDFSIIPFYGESKCAFSRGQFHKTLSNHALYELRPVLRINNILYVCITTTWAKSLLSVQDKIQASPYCQFHHILQSLFIERWGFFIFLSLKTRGPSISCNWNFLIDQQSKLLHILYFDRHQMSNAE